MELGGLSNFTGLLFIFLFLGLILGFAFLARRWPFLKLREIPAFSRLTGAVGLSVEDGTRLHVSIGAGGVTGSESASAFVGLRMLRQVAEITSVSDHPPIATAGEGALAISGPRHASNCHSAKWRRSTRTSHGSIDRIDAILLCGWNAAGDF